jgi:hypothetical protein
VHPALRTFRDELGDFFIRLLAYVGGVAVLALVAMRMFGTPAVKAAIETAPRSDWVNVARPYRAFALTIPDFAEPEPDYAIRRHAIGGGRRDIMSWGERGQGARFMLEIYRPGQEIERFDTPAAEIAARSGELGGVGAIRPAEVMDSKFGPIALYEFTVGSGERAHHCLGFARAFDEPRLQIAGWHCRAAHEVIERGTLSCALDRLSLLMAASDPKVSELFARAELKRQFCRHQAWPAAGHVRRKDWIDSGKEPKLRGRVVAR